MKKTMSDVCTAASPNNKVAPLGAPNGATHNAVESPQINATASATFNTSAILSLTTSAPAMIGSVSEFRLEPSVAEVWSVRLDEGPDAGALPLAAIPSWGGLDERILHLHYRSTPVNLGRDAARSKGRGTQSLAVSGSEHSADPCPSAGVTTTSISSSSYSPL
jgi:hypothetical protein